jgi:hypothetical protein
LREAGNLFFPPNSWEVLPIIEKGSFTKTHQPMDKPQQPKIAIVGLGYVGIHLSLEFARI